jgi:uncharacterized membrane protein
VTVRRSFTNSLVRPFLNGVLVVAPLGVTVYACVWVFRSVDGWMATSRPGLGFLLALCIIWLIGFAASGFLTRRLVDALENVLGRLPLVRLLHGSTKDLIGAFIGERRRFNSPVLVAVGNDPDVLVLGFVTQSSLAMLGLPGHVACLVPQAFHWAGQLYLVPATRVRCVPTASGVDVLAFALSGGVSGSNSPSAAESPAVVAPSA